MCGVIVHFKVCKTCFLTSSCSFTVDVHNVTLDPSVNPLTIREGTLIKVKCVVNSNAVPAPTITWYLDSEFMTKAEEYSKIGNRMDNKKTLECRASNNNNKEKTTNTILNIECRYIVIDKTVYS